MGFQTLNNHDLIRRLRCIGITNTLARQIVAQFNEWRKHTGDEWTCSHIKDMKVDLIRHIGGLPPISPWIERRKDKVTPTGPFGALWAIARKKPFTALNAINIYTSLLYKPDGEDIPRITPKQLKGFEDAVHRPPVTRDADLAYRELLRDMPMEWHNPVPEFKAPPLLDVPVKPYKRSPIPQRGMVPKEQVFPRALTVLSLAPAFYWKHKALLDSALGIVKDLVPMMDPKDGPKRILEDDPIPVVLNKLVNFHISRDGISDQPGDIIAGNVSFIQDSGYKLRHIFVTNEILQISSLPLQEFLMHELRHLPQDATFDQDAGVRRVQEYMRSGLTAHCFDLQKCSDNLPRSFQISLFRHLGLGEEWIEWFRDVTSARWELRDRIPVQHPDGKPTSLLPSSARYSYPKGRISYMRMTVGQQLGFGPSFPAFALLHHSIIRGIARRFGRPLAYVLLGDDIVIFDDELARQYVHYMSVFGVPISSSKTIESKRIAEFAGRVILPDRVISTYKWRGRCSDNNFLDICKALGPRSLGLLRPRQRFIAEVLGWIPEPFGLGWNPEGLTYESRMKFTEELWLKLIDEKDIRVRSYQRRTSRMNALVYAHPEWTKGLNLRPSADQADFRSFLEAYPLNMKTQGLVVRLLLHDWESFLPNVDYLARSRDIGGLNGTEISNLLSRYSWIERLSKMSQLVVLERKLGFSHQN